MTKFLSVDQLKDDYNRRDYVVAGRTSDPTPFPIVSINLTVNAFVVEGDQTKEFYAGKKFMVRGTAASDNSFTVSAATFDGTNTTIVTSETISGGAVDQGGCYVRGALAASFTIV